MTDAGRASCLVVNIDTSEQLALCHDKLTCAILRKAVYACV